MINPASQTQAVRAGFETVFGWQWRQVVLPAAGANVPAAQVLQVAAALEFEKLPGAHGGHAVEP